MYNSQLPFAGNVPAVLKGLRARNELPLHRLIRESFVIRRFREPNEKALGIPKKKFPHADGAFLLFRSFFFVSVNQSALAVVSRPFPPVDSSVTNPDGNRSWIKMSSDPFRVYDGVMPGGVLSYKLSSNKSRTNLRHRISQLGEGVDLSAAPSPINRFRFDPFSAPERMVIRSRKTHRKVR